MTQSAFLSTLVSILLLSSMAQAQDLSLFEPVENEAATNAASSPQSREQLAMLSAPAFTLVGTARIGSRYKVTLASSNGGLVVVDTRAGVPQSIPDQPGFQIVDVSARQVAIAGAPCVAATDKGVSCSAEGNSLLSLATAAPMALPTNSAAAQADPAVAGLPVDAPPDNPFAAALRAAAQNEANAQGAAGGERFQPRRIAPEEVPPGMRLVRTPFGDRLVEQ